MAGIVLIYPYETQIVAGVLIFTIVSLAYMVIRRFPRFQGNGV